MYISEARTYEEPRSMKSIFAPVVRAAFGLTLAAFLAACNTGGGGSSTPPDVGNNDINTVACMGDSITQGQCVPAGAPYPARLGSLTGKNVINQGVCGAKSSDGANAVNGVLSEFKPGYL